MRKNNKCKNNHTLTPENTFIYRVNCVGCGRPFEPKEELLTTNNISNKLAEEEVVEKKFNFCGMEIKTDPTMKPGEWKVEKGVITSNPPLEVKEVSKDIEWEKEFDEYFTWHPTLRCIYIPSWGDSADMQDMKDYIKSLLSQQEAKITEETKEFYYRRGYLDAEAKIKRELVEKIEGMKAEELNSHWLYLVKPEQAFVKALDDIKSRLLSE